MRALLLLAPLALAACGREDPQAEAKALIAANCAACHQVPGVRQATGHVGPSLAGIARRQVIAGHFPNTRPNLVRWIYDPQAMIPGDAMPNTGISAQQAGQITDYLTTLDE